MSCQKCETRFTYDMNCLKCRARWISMLPPPAAEAAIKKFKSSNSDDELQELVALIEQSA